MQKSWSTPFVESFENAFSEIKAKYQGSPFVYLNKWDIVVDLYSRMKDLDRLEEVESGRFTFGKDGRWRQKKVNTDRVSTTPLHVSMGFESKDRPRSDISYIDLSTMQFAITARYSRKNPTSLSDWRYTSGAGITVVMNNDVQYSKRKNNQTGRFAKTEGQKVLEREVLKEISNLKDWDKSILLFVDNHGLFTKNELEASFAKKLNPYTMKLYYLTPKSGFFITGKRQQREE